MPAIKLEQFGGQLPAWDDHLLPAGQSASSLNGYLFSGALTGWRAPKFLRNLNNSSATMIYRVPTIVKGTASSILTIISVPNEGDTVKIGEDVYTFTATITNPPPHLQTPFTVHIGGTAAACANNLFAAITVDNNTATNMGSLYGMGTCFNPAISQVTGVNTLSTNVITVVAPATGSAYNTTVTTESTGGVRMSWNHATFTGGINQSFDSSITGAATWLEFVDPYTDVMKTPVVDDQYNRYYFASPSLPPQYNTYDRIVAGNPPWLLGINPPGCAPGVEVVGGGNLSQLGFPNSISVNTNSVGGNSLFLIPITPTGAMQLDDVAFMTPDTSTTAQFAAVVYGDNSGQPGLLMNTGVIQVGCTSGTAVVSTFTNPSPLSVNIQYWIGFVTDTTININLADDLANGNAQSAANTFTNGPPLVAPTMTTGLPDWQMWADLTTSSVLEDRAYVYTWVTQYGEESQPSPPTLVTGWSNATWTINLFTPPTDDMGVLRNVVYTRLYRTISGTSGQTVYYLVTPAGASATDPTAANIPVTQATFVDTVDDSVISLNTILPSVTWSPPPENLQGIMSMPNGMAVGFRNNEIWFSEPYRPHAWPANYVLTTEFPIIGIGVTGQSVVACTSSTPYVATGVNPSSMSSSKVLIKEPCISRGSILSTDTGVFYMSPNGLISVTQYGVATNTTELWITREKWRLLTPSAYVRAISIASSYFAFGTVSGSDHTQAQDGFTIELAADTASFTIWPQPGGHRLGFNQLNAPNGFDIYNVQMDPWTGIGLLVQNSQVFYYDFTDQAPTMVPYTWRSKIYQQPSKKNFEAMRIFFSVPTGSPVQGTRNTSATNDPSWNTLAANQYGIVRVFADGNLVTTREIRTSGELLRVLSGFKYEQWQFEFTGRVIISNCQVATSVKELGTV